MFFREISVNGAHGRFGQPFAIVGAAQKALFILVRQVPHFHQDGRNVRGFQHGKTGEPVRVRQKANFLAQFLHDFFGKERRVVVRFPARQINQDIGDFLCFPAQINAGDDVGFVFTFGQLFRFNVGSLLRQSINRQAARFGFARAVGVDGDEQVGVDAPGKLAPGAQGDGNILVARQLDPVLSRGQRSSLSVFTMASVRCFS